MSGKRTVGYRVRLKDNGGPFGADYVEGLHGFGSWLLTTEPPKPVPRAEAVRLMGMARRWRNRDGRDAMWSAADLRIVRVVNGGGK